MNRRHALKTLAALALCPICAKPGFAAEGAHWSYEGDTGPAKWGDLDAANKVCSAGSQQSPIDVEATMKARLWPLELSWARRAETIVNNGHTIQLNFGERSRLKLDDTTYRLVQVHFHRPSEHLIGGKNFPMEAHFVHRAETGNLAVIGVLMAAGRPNRAFSRIVAAMPQAEGPAVKLESDIDPHALLPDRHGYYRYSGSLTTPPCSEIVQWLVMATPIHVAEADIASFAKVYPMNARPVQKLDRRYVLRSS
jgi:carbonic anhydrase